MRVILIISFIVGFTSCSSFNPNHIDWANAPLNPTPFGPWGVTANHYNLKGDVKQAYRVSYVKRDSAYIRSALYLITFNKKRKVLTEKKGLFTDFFDAETTYYYDDNKLTHRVKTTPVKTFKSEYCFNKRGELISPSLKNSFVYDKHGNFMKKSNTNGRYGVEYFYDKQNRLIKSKYYNREGNLKSIDEYCYSMKGDKMIVTIANTKENFETETLRKRFDKYGYKIAGIDSLNNSTNKIVRDKKGNVIKDICGDRKKYFVIEYWDGTTSGYDPRLDLQKQ